MSRMKAEIQFPIITGLALVRKQPWNPGNGAGENFSDL